MRTATGAGTLSRFASGTSTLRHSTINLSTFYPPPLDRLLTLGAEPARRRTWPDYRTLGLQDQHVPALIRMAADPALHDAPERDRAAWAPVHAWRALGQLRASAAAGPLFLLLQRDFESDWVRDEVPVALGMIGPAVLPGATLILFDEEREEPVRVLAATVIARVGLEHPDRADEAAAVLKTQLQDWATQGRWLNANLIAGLVELQATDAAPLMEAAYAADAVDLEIWGDWEDVQVDLGLLPERTTPPAPFARSVHAGARQAARRAAEQARQRRKAEKKARKRNRRK